MKSNFKKILIGALVLLGLVLIWYFFIRKKTIPETVLTEKPVKGYIAESVTATGKIEPVDTVTVGTQISGILKNVYVDFNSKVKKGEILARLDKTLLQASLDQYKGNLNNARSQLVYAKNNYIRQDLLYKTDAISRADHDIALNTYQAAKGLVFTAQAQVNSALKSLSYADIYSPIDGVVLNRNISVGQTVAASFSTPTFFIIAKDITKMQVEAHVDEADIGDVRTKDRVTFSVDAFINDQFNGIVTEIRLHPSINANVVTYTTIINAPNNDMKLKPGMTANIIIYTKEVKEAILIPSKAISFNPDSALYKTYEIIGKTNFKLKKSGSNLGLQASHSSKSRGDTTAASSQTAKIWILQENKLIQKSIKIGINDNTQVEVLSGLEMNDLVVTRSITGSETSASSTTGGSPFLPKRQTKGGKAR